MLSRRKCCMFEQVSVSTGNQWMAVSLAFSIYVMSSLKQIPGLSYPVHSPIQPSHCHNLWSVSDSKCQRRWICRHWDISRLPEWFRWKKNQPPSCSKHEAKNKPAYFCLFICSFSNIYTVLSHTEKLFFWYKNYWKSPRKVCPLLISKLKKCLDICWKLPDTWQCFNQPLNFEGSCHHHDIPSATESPDLCLQTIKTI